MYGKIAIGVALPFVGTALGAATVFLLKNQLKWKILCKKEKSFFKKLFYY